jgi:hypothetical protein
MLIIRYQVGYWFRLIDASICWAIDETDTQVANFKLLGTKKATPHLEFLYC